MQSVRRLVIGIDQGRRCNRHRSNGLKSGRPAVLREIVVEDAETGTNHRFLAVSGRVDDPEPGTKLPPVVEGDRLGVSQLGQELEPGIGSLTYSRRGEEPKSGLPPQPVIEGQM